MEYEKILQECKARAEVYRKCDAIWNLTHEEQCYKAITELLTRAEKAEREKDAALKDLRETSWCQHCTNWEDMNNCLQLVKKEESVRLCVLCKRKCFCKGCTDGSKWKWRGDIMNGNKNDCNNDFNV